MATNSEAEDAITSGALLDTDADQGVIAKQNNSQNTAMVNEEDQAKATPEAAKGRVAIKPGAIEDAADEDGSKTFPQASKRSASLATGATKDLADEDDPKRFHEASKRSASLGAGVIEHAADEDWSKKFHEALKRSASFGTRAMAGVADDDGRKTFHQPSKRSASLATGATEDLSDEDSRKRFHEASQRSASLGAGVIERATDEAWSKKNHETSKRSASLAIEVIERVADDDDHNILHQTSKRSASLAAGAMAGVADEDSSKNFHHATKARVSIKTGAFVDVEDEDGSKIFHQASKRSASLGAGGIEHGTEDDWSKTFHEASKRSASLGTRTMAGVVDEDDNNVFHQAAKISASIAAEAIKNVADEHSSKVSQHPMDKRVSISDSATDEHGNKILIGKKNIDYIVDHSNFTRTLQNRTSLSSVIHDPSMPKGRNESKRASFQTSVIEGLTIDDTKEDDDSEGEKLLWKRMFERKVAKRVLNLQEQKSAFRKKRKQEKANLEKKVPMDMLTKEWFNENKMTVQTRIYLLEKLFPTLILGLEKLLMEVEKKSLIVLETTHPYFNPINFLAQYLMKNNPWYCNVPKEDPYTQGLKHVVKELKDNVADIKANRLYTLKAETLLRQKERERLDKLQLDNQEKKRETLRLQFRDWVISTNGNVLLSLAQSVLVSFSEAFADYIFETFEDVRYDKELEEIDTTGQTLNEEEFVAYMYSYVKSLSDNPFQDFLVYLSHSSDFFRHKGQNDWWRQQFAELFVACDIGKAGLLNRHRIISLFEQFYDSHSGINKSKFRNPREWPVIEFDEMEPVDFIHDFGNEYSSAEPPAKEATAGQEQTEGADQTSVEGEKEEVRVEEGGEIVQKKLTRFSLTGDVGEFLPNELTHSIIFDEQNAATSKFPGLTAIMSDILSRGHSLITSPFNKDSVNRRQFVQLMETFVGNVTESSAIESLIKNIRYGYGETKEERIERLTQANHAALAATHMLILDALFEKWDNDVSGYINLRELADVLSTYKDGMEKNALKRAHHKLKLYHKYDSDNPTLSKTEFRSYIEKVVAEISGDESVFESVVTFLTTRNEQNCMERARRTARRRWFYDIQRAAETSSSSLENVYKAVFQTLYKDSEAHGQNKKISSSIALLRRNNHRPERGEYFLHYVACTLEDAPYVLNQALYRDMGVSFSAVDKGKPLHILNIREHGSVHIWNCHRERIDGSFLVIPLKDQHNRVFGVLGTDTLRDKCVKYFTTHEINFYQGVAKAFSIAYHHVRVRNDILKVVDSGMLWLYNEAPNIETAITYLAEPITSRDYVLCKTMTTENDFEEGWSDVHVPPMILQRKDNYFRNYLFKCADTSEVVYSTTYKGRRVCVPLRDLTGRALATLDIDLGTPNQLLAHEYRSLLKMLKIVHIACHRIVKETTGTPETAILTDRDDEEKRERLLFHQLMLGELRESIKNLNEQALVEIWSSKHPPPALVHNIFLMVFHLLQPKLSEESITWKYCKENLNRNLIQSICAFDPVKTFVNVDTHLLSHYFKGIDPGAVWQYGSLPMYYLHQWAFVCFTLIQLTTKLRNFYRPPSVCHLPST